MGGQAPLLLGLRPIRSWADTSQDLSDPVLPLSVGLVVIWKISAELKLFEKASIGTTSSAGAIRRDVRIATIGVGIDVAEDVVTVNHLVTPMGVSVAD